jgi:hypothetical protein
VTEQSGNLNLSVSIGSASFSASGDKQVVLDAYEDFKALLESLPVPAPTREAPASPAPDAGAAPPDGAAVASVKSPTSLPLKPYLEGLTLKGNKEKATAIVAWSAESGEKAALTVTDVEKLWKKTPFRAPANLPRDLRKAEAEGWIERQGKDGSPEATYSINGYGEGIVAGWTKSGS